MTDFEENTVRQTTLASMFPISYQVMRDSFMSPRTPQPSAPLAPEKVRPLITTPFSLHYTGFLSITDLNTELLFIARAVCAATQSVAGGVGIVGATPLLIDITFVDVTVDDVATPLILQGLNLTGNLSFSGAQTSFGIVHCGYNVISGDLAFGGEVTVASLELYENVIAGNITLPSGSSLLSILVYGQYPQISLTVLSNKKIYPSLNSILYLNGVDGMGDRDVPSAARGFGAYSLSGLTQPSYPLITALATTDPWKVDLQTVFPNLLSLIVVDYQRSGVVTIPETANSRYSLLTFIGARSVTSLDLSSRSSYLTNGLRIVGCPHLTGVLLRSDAAQSSPLREYKTLIIERSALIYLRGTRGMVRPPITLRLGDHTISDLMMSTRPTGTRLLDYVLQAAPMIGNVTAVASDYLPNVLVQLAEAFPSLILYPVMQTVEYQFTKAAAVAAGTATTSYTQYSGGANPVVPATGTSLSSAVITVSPFGVRYVLRVGMTSSVASTSVTDVTASSSTSTTKGSLFPSFAGSQRREWITAAIAVSVVGVIMIVVAIAIVLARRRTTQTVKPSLKR